MNYVLPCDTPGGVAVFFRHEDIASVVLGRDVEQRNENGEPIGLLSFQAVVTLRNGGGGFSLHDDEALSFVKTWARFEGLTEEQMDVMTRGGWPIAWLPKAKPTVDVISEGIGT